MKQKIRLTENGLRRTIKKCLFEALYKPDKKMLRTTLNEGYSGIHFESQVNAIVQSFMEHKQLVDRIVEKQGYFYTPYSNYEIKISLKPFFKNGEVLSKFRRNKSYYVKIKYDWNKEDHYVSGYYNPKLLHKTDFQIVITVPKNASFDEIRATLMHEVTHLVDDLIKECKSIKTYRYPDRQMEKYGLPFCVRMLLYALWTNTEFNAWQASYLQKCGDEYDFIEILNGYLNEARQLNDKQIWTKIFDFVKTKNPNEKIKRMTCESFRNYFIKTSTKLLKKFANKISYQRV